MAPPTLTIIVAATRTMGIGLRGTLPWPRLKQEMAYFARVTKRPPTAQSPDAYGHPCINAVIMGRKTWESIPERFRPLKGRVNVVVSRTPEKLGSPEQGAKGTAEGKVHEQQLPIGVKSIGEGLAALHSRYTTSGSGSRGQDSLRLGHVFVIGGAEIYAAALQMPECERILMTSILTDFECDTFFPLDLGAEDTEKQAERWVKREKRALDEWAGEEVPGGVRSEGQVDYRFELWER